MKKFLFVCFIIFCIFSTLSGRENLSGRDIMQKVKDVPNGEDRKGETTMILINKKNNRRVRKVLFFEKEMGKKSSSVMYFTAPADVRGTGFLQYSYDDKSKNDDKWLYLPAFKRLRRISSSQKNDRFMGTDFTYDDMSRHHIDDYRHKFLKEEKYEGKKCWIVESRSKNKDSMYGKTVKWVRKDNHIPVKVEYYDKEGKPLKVMKVEKLEKKNGFWVAVKTVMHNVQENHKTIMTIDEISHDSGLKDSFFRPNTLENGISR